MNCTPENSIPITKPAKNKPTIQVNQSGAANAKSSGKKDTPQTPTAAHLQAQAQKQLLSQSQIIVVKQPQSQNLPALNSPHIHEQQHPAPPPQQQAKPQNNDERITNLLGRILQIEKNDHQRRAMLLKSVKLFLSQKNPALTQPMISLFLLVFKSVFSTAPPFSVITKSYRHIYFNPRDHPEDVSICYQLFEIINCLQPAYPNDLLQSLVRRLSSASISDRNGAKKCLISIDIQYSPFLLHTLCLEMIPPPPHGIDTLLELTTELLKHYKSTNLANNKCGSNTSSQKHSSSEKSTPSSPKSNHNQSPSLQNHKLNSNLETNKLSNSKLNSNTNSYNVLPSVPISIPNPKNNQSSTTKSSTSNNQKSNVNSNKAANPKKNQHVNMPTVPISVPNPHSKPKLTVKINTDNKTNLIKNPKSNDASNQNVKTNANSNETIKPNLNPKLKANDPIKASSNQILKPNEPTKTKSNSNPTQNPNDATETNSKSNSNDITKSNPNETVKSNANAKSDQNQISNSIDIAKPNPNETGKSNANAKSNPNQISNFKSSPDKSSTTISPNSNSSSSLIPLTKSNSDSRLIPPVTQPSIKPPTSALKTELENEAIVIHLREKLEASTNDSLFSELQRTFRLLHFAPHFQAFFHPLVTAMTTLISKNENLAHESRRFLLNYWPRLDPQKAVLFLQEATTLCKEGPEIEEFVWQRLSWRASSIQWQIAMEGLNFISQTYQRATEFDNSVLIYLLKDTIQHHWNNNVKNKAADVLQLVDKGEARAPKVFPIDKWSLLKSQAETNYPDTDFTGRRRRKK